MKTQNRTYMLYNQNKNKLLFKSAKGKKIKN